MAIARASSAASGRWRHADLSAVARDLLHQLDASSARSASPRAPAYDFLTIYVGPILMIGLVLAADHAHRAARQGAEHHLDRRLHRRALRQGAGRRRDRGADRDRRHHPLHRAPAQSRVVVARAPSSPTLEPASGATQPVLGDISLFVALLDGDLRGPVRHPPHRRHRAPGRPDAGDRDRESIVKLVAFVGRRRLRDVLDVRRAAGAVCARAAASRRPPRCCTRRAGRSARSPR